MIQGSTPLAFTLEPVKRKEQNTTIRSLPPDIWSIDVGQLKNTLWNITFDLSIFDKKDVTVTRVTIVKPIADTITFHVYPHELPHRLVITGYYAIDQNTMRKYLLFVNISGNLPEDSYLSAKGEITYMY